MNAQPLVEHLKELRRRLMWVAAVLLLCLFAAVPFANRLYALVAKPLMASLPPGAHMQAIDVIAPVFVPLKVALMAAFLVSLPHTLYQLWAFVAPATAPKPGKGKSAQTGCTQPHGRQKIAKSALLVQIKKESG